MGTTSTPKKTAADTDTKIEGQFRGVLKDELGAQTKILKAEMNETELHLPPEVVSMLTEIGETFDMSKLDDMLLFAKAAEEASPAIKREMKKLREKGEDEDSDTKETDRYNKKDLLAAAKKTGDEKLQATIEFQEKFASLRFWEHRQTRGFVGGVVVAGAVLAGVKTYAAYQVGNAEGDLGDEGEFMPHEVMSA